MTRQTYRFKGTMTAESSLNVTRPNETFPSPPGSPFGLSATSGRLPRLGPLHESSPVMFPASSIRGAIRRAARNSVRRAIIRQSGEKTPWSIDTHYMLTQGVDTSNKTKKTKNSEVVDGAMALREANPFLSLFGRWGLASHLGIDNAIPHTKECVYAEHGARTNDFVRDPEQTQFISVDDAKRLKQMIVEDGEMSLTGADIDKQIKALKAEQRQVKDADDKAEIREQIKALETQKKDAKAQKIGSQEPIQYPHPGFEAIIPGTTMSHRMLVRSADAYELGLTLAALREFARQPYLGGHRALGFGEVAFDWVVSYWPEDGDPVQAGRVQVGADIFFISEESDDKSLSSALSQWDEVMASTDMPFDFKRFLMVG